MQKICPHCGEERDIETEFRWKYKDRGVRQRWCKYCQAEAMKVHYQNNKQIYVDRAMSRNSRVSEENRKKLFAYLSEHPCVDCGNTDIRCLDFDHVRGTKDANISKLLSHSVEWEVIEAEIAKCEVRCANCHRIKTLERAGQWRFLRAERE